MFARLVLATEQFQGQTIVYETLSKEKEARNQ